MEAVQEGMAQVANELSGTSGAIKIRASLAKRVARATTAVQLLTKVTYSTGHLKCRFWPVICLNPDIKGTTLS
jgi:hypothetical protein